MVSHRRRKNRHANKLARRLVTKVREAESELPEYVASPAAASQQPASQQQSSPSASQKEEKDNACSTNNQSEASSPSSLSKFDPPASTTAPTTTSPAPTNIWSTHQQPQPSPEQQQAAAVLQLSWGSKDLASSLDVDKEASSPNPQNPFFGASCVDFSNDKSLPTIDNKDDKEDTAVTNENDAAVGAGVDNTDKEDHQSARILQQLCWWRDLTPHEKERIAQASPCTNDKQETVAKFVREAKQNARQQKEVAIGAIQQKYRSSLMNLGKSSNNNNDGDDAVPVLSVQVPLEEEENKQESPVKEIAPSQQKENLVGAGHSSSPSTPHTKTTTIPFKKPDNSSSRKQTAKTTTTSSSNIKTATSNRSIRDTILIPTTKTNIQKVPRPSQHLQGVDMKGIYKSAFQVRWVELRAHRIRRSEAAREIQQWWTTRNNNDKNLNQLEHRNDKDNSEEEEDSDDQDTSTVESADQSIGDSSSSDSQSEGSDSSSDDEEDEDELTERKSISWGCLLLVMTFVIGMIALAIVLAADAGEAKALMVELSKSSSNRLDEGNASAPGSADGCEAQGECESVFR